MQLASAFLHGRWEAARSAEGVDRAPEDCDARSGGAFGVWRWRGRGADGRATSVGTSRASRSLQRGSWTAAIVHSMMSATKRGTSPSDVARRSATHGSTIASLPRSSRAARSSANGNGQAAKYSPRLAASSAVSLPATGPSSIRPWSSSTVGPTSPGSDSDRHVLAAHDLMRCHATVNGVIAATFSRRARRSSRSS